MEESLKLRRMELLRQGAPDSDDEDWDNSQWPEEKEDGPVKEEDDSLENEDLAFITSVLESFSRDKSKATKPSKPFYAISTPEGAPVQTEARKMTQQKFNQNSTSESSATEKFRCFPTIEEEGAGEFSDEEDTQSEIDPVKVEAGTPFQSIYSISEERGKPFSSWRLYIPPEPVFRNSPAQSWWSVSSPPEYSSLEPTPTRILAINYSTSGDAIKPIQIPVSTTHTKTQMKQTSQHSWKSYKPITKRYGHRWNKHWQELNRMSKRKRNLHGHPEQSKPFKLWKPQLPSSDRTNTNPNMRYQNMPPETDAGDNHQLFTQCLSRISSSTTSRTNTNKTRSWGTKWRKWSDRIPNWHKKFPVPTRHRRRSSKRTPSWLWSPRRWPCTCSSDIAMDQNGTMTQERRTSPHGGNHFSKRKSESENESKSREIVKMKTTDSKTIETKRTRMKESWKVKADKAKAIKRPKTEIRKKIKR
jgi:hypothetical protein